MQHNEKDPRSNRLLLGWHEHQPMAMDAAVHQIVLIIGVVQMKGVLPQHIKDYRSTRNGPEDTMMGMSSQ